MLPTKVQQIVILVFQKLLFSRVRVLLLRNQQSATIRVLLENLRGKQFLLKPICCFNQAKLENAYKCK